LTALTEAERHAIRRYLRLLHAELGSSLEEAWLFGSAARDEMWADFWPMRSDVDLLVVVADELAPTREQELFDLTYPLYVDCGRQISPAFRTHTQLLGQWAPLRREVQRDGVRLWPEAAATVAS
jgi:predicted nucleotidyltransferase